MSVPKTKNEKLIFSDTIILLKNLIRNTLLKNQAKASYLPSRFGVKGEHGLYSSLKKTTLNTLRQL